jgi:hypothetical protein
LNFSVLMKIRTGPLSIIGNLVIREAATSGLNARFQRREQNLVPSRQPEESVEYQWAHKGRSKLRSNFFVRTEISIGQLFVLANLVRFEVAADGLNAA